MYSGKEIIYYIYFSIMLLAKGIGLYEGMPVFNLCLAVSTGVLLLKMAMDSYSLREAACIFALVSLGVIIWRKSGEKGPLLYLLMLVGMKDIPVKRVFRIGLLVWGGAFGLQMLLALTGIRTGTVMAHNKLGLGHILRWSFGYPHPNVLHISYVIFIAFLFYVLHLEGKKLVGATVLGFIGNLYIFLYSVSYTGFLLTAVYFICNLYLNLRKNRRKAEDIMLQAVFPCCVVFSVAGPLVLQGKLFEICDKLLNTRFSLSRYFMYHGNWSLLGDRQAQVRAESVNYTLDCSYTYLLMHGGIIIFSIMCVGYFMLIRHYVKENKKKELAVILGLLVAGISEPFLFNTAYKNLSLIFMGNYLFEVLEEKSKEGFRLQILHLGGKKIGISATVWENMADEVRYQMKKRKYQIAGIGIAAAICGGAAYAFMADVPDSIYILRQGSDRYDEVVYLDENNLPENFHSRIISYKDAQTPMYELKGNIVTVEYVRGIVSCGLWAGVLIPAIYLAIYGSQNKIGDKR
ncbi:MAG: hypothetical protein HFI04_01195 [Lachnospiraceae bacterium]|jgi:hypothetical protein|nr:hypothetical protein [Lachnospiraceae bacterium]